MGVSINIYLHICTVMIDQNSLFPSERPYSPVQRNVPLCGGLPYRWPDMPTQRLPREPFLTLYRRFSYNGTGISFNVPFSKYLLRGEESASERSDGSGRSCDESCRG